MNKKRLISCVILMLVGFLQFTDAVYGAASGANSDKKPCRSQLEIFDMIRNKDYKGLEESLRNCQENYEKDVSAEIALYSAYEAFNSSYPSLEQALNQWVSKYPSSYVALLARGNYLEHKGYRARGFRWASDTSEEQFKAMNDTFEFASKDLHEAIRLYPKALVAYCGLININGSSSSRDSLRKTWEMGLRVLPDSLMIRQGYLHFLQPKWGGTAIELDEAMSEIGRSSHRYEKLRVLQGYRALISAEMLFDQGSYDEAVQLYLKALEYGDFFHYYIRLGVVYDKLQKYDQSIAANTKAMQLGPVGPVTLWRRAHSMIQSGSRAEAMKDINLGLSLFPDDKFLLDLRDSKSSGDLSSIQQKAYSLIQAGSLTDALKEIDHGLSQFPNDRYLLDLHDYCTKRMTFYQK